MRIEEEWKNQIRRSSLWQVTLTSVYLAHHEPESIFLYNCHLACIKAGERRAQNLQKVAGSSEGVIHVVVVGVGVVTMPIQDVIPHIQAVSWNVSWGVPHAVELVPKHTLCPAQSINSG